MYFLSLSISLCLVCTYFHINLLSKTATVANGGGKKKKPNAAEGQALFADPRPKEYTQKQWDQWYNGKRCVKMTDEELTRGVLEDMTTYQLEAVSVSRSTRLASNPKRFRDNKPIDGSEKVRLFKNLLEWKSNPDNGKNVSLSLSLSSLSHLLL